MLPKQKPLNRGDIVIIDFDPQSGNEIMKRRSALIISPQIYNQKSTTLLCCPITSKVKVFNPWHVVLPKGFKIEGAIISDQIKSFDPIARKAKKIALVPENIMEEVLERIVTLVT